MQTNAWYVSLVFVFVSYLALTLLADFRLPVMIFFSFVFSYVVSRDEWRVGRTVLLSVVPLVLGVALLFVAALFSAAISGSPIQSSQLSHAAIGFLVLLFLCAAVGLPLAYAGALLRRYRLSLSPAG